MNTTLNKIRERSPCSPSWEKLLASLGKTKADDEPVNFKHLLDVLGIDDAVWCLRTLTYKEQCLFLADVAESMLPDFEKDSDDPTPRDCIQAIRDYKQGLIDYAELQAAAKAAAKAAACVAKAAAEAAARVAYAVAYAAAFGALATYAAANVTRHIRGDKWQEIEALFVKHFVDKG